jgi:hypothetical protein
MPEFEFDPTLIEALQRQELVFLLGPELPRALTGLPSISELAQELASRYSEPLDLSFAEVAERVAQRYDPSVVVGFLQSGLSRTDGEPASFFQALVQLVGRTHTGPVLTTAFDDQLEQAFARAGLQVTAAARDLDLPADPAWPLVIHLFGRLDLPDTLVLSAADRQALPADQDRHQLLDAARRALARGPVLLIGWDIHDATFEWLLDLLAGGYFKGRAYALQAELAEDDLRMWQARGAVCLKAGPLDLVEGLLNYLGAGIPDSEGQPSSSLSSGTASAPESLPTTPPATPEAPPSDHRLRILSLDGTGLDPGLAPYLLARLESAVPGFLGAFDLYAGVSGNAALALALATGRSPEDYGRAYLKFFYRAYQGVQAQDVFHKLLLETFGDLHLGDLPRRVLALALDADRASLKVYHSYLTAENWAGESLVDVALRATALPLQMPPYQDCLDASLIASHPGMCALAQVLDRRFVGVRLQDVALFSLADPYAPRSLEQDEDTNLSIADWAPHLLPLCQDSRASITHFQLERLLGPHYFRLWTDWATRPADIRGEQLAQIAPRWAEAVDISAAVDWLKRYVM